MKILQLIKFLILLVCLSYPTAAGAEALGRLFFSPQDRLALEQLRWASPELLPLVHEQQQETVVAPDSKPVTVTLSGAMIRSNGAQVVWMNGVSYKKAELPATVQVTQPFISGQIELRMVEKGEFFLLRPGQTLEIDSGQVSESYQRDAAVSVPGAGATQRADLKQPAAVEDVPLSAPVQGTAPALPLK